MALIEIRVPDLGSFKDVVVIDILVKPGDTLELDTSIATLETEKATMDVPASAAGVVKSLHIERGGKVNTGDLVATVEASGVVAAAPAAPQKAAPAVTSAPAAAPAAAAPAAVAPAAATKASPAAATAIPGARADLRYL